MYRVLIIVPCFNEGENIKRVIYKINDFINTCPQPDLQIDYIIINDSSTDGSLDICIQNNFNYLNLPVNLGIGGAVQTGYLYAYKKGYDIAIQHDGDGQHDPGYFSDVISPIISKKADIVIGSRFINKTGFQSTGLRRFGISFLSGIIHLCTGKKLRDVTSGYRAVNKKFIEIFANQYAQDYPEPEAIIDAVRKNAEILEIPVAMHEREAGKSSISSFKSMHYMIKVSLSILLHRLIIPKGENE
jgi:glycosyltransferase involved in cell wall biosynthesis